MKATGSLKICSHCHIEKELGEFGKLKSSSDGLLGKCRECQREYQKKYYNSVSGKNAHQKYRDSVKGKITKQKYANTPVRKLYEKKRSKTQEYKESQYKYIDSPKGIKTRAKNAEYFRSKSKNYPEFVNLPQRWSYKRSIVGAKKRNMDFNLTYEEFIEPYTGYCALSGQKLYCTKTVAQSSGNHTASCDRINSSLGYIRGNIEWVSKDINIAKMAKTNEQFLQMCAEVTDYNRNRLGGLN